MSSTCSVALRADGVPDLFGPATGSSPPARSTNGGAVSLPQTTPDAACIPTCASSPPSASATTSDSFPTSSSEAHPARRSAPPTPRERALRMITCSGTSPASSSRCDLFGVRLRTLLARELQASTGYSLRWTRQATPAGHPWWVLSTPEPTTSDDGFGLLLPTPSASSYGSNRGGAGGRTGDAKPSLPTFLNTPRASSGYDSEEFAGGAAINPRKLIYTMIPTPDTRGSGSQAYGRDAHLPRSERRRTAALMDFCLPTPTARDTRSDRASDHTMARNSRPLSETSGSLGLTGTAESPVSQRRALLLGLVLWMMGQTPSWLRACAIAPPPRSAMRSSRKSRKRSAEPCGS